MLIKTRSFTREDPERNATRIYIFCEGKDREYHYFSRFVRIDSSLNLNVYELKSDDNNSPNGLYNLAVKCLVKSDDNPDPQYDDYREGEMVWIILDTDKDGHKGENSRASQLVNVRQQCNALNWSIAQSNPCFEVWLYYHQESQKPNFEDIEVSSKWKTFVGDIIKGGFDPRKHPVLIQTAITNAENQFDIDQNGLPEIATTEVFKLAQNILSVGKIKEKIEHLLRGIG